MEIEYTGRQATVTKKLKQRTESGLERVSKLVGRSCSAHVILTTEKYRHSADITLRTKTYKLVAKCEATEMDVALHDALNKIEQQAIRHSQKATAIKRHSIAGGKGLKGNQFEVPDELPRVRLAEAQPGGKSSSGRTAVQMLIHSFPSRSPLAELRVVRGGDSVALRPMSLEEAVKEAAFRDRDVFIFRDHTGNAMVLHRKRDGKIELFEVP